MKTLYRFTWDCRRMGILSGLFIADSDEISKVIGKKIYFGEVLGKHSEIYGVLEEQDLEIVTTDPLFLDQCEQYIGKGTLSGYNPLDYYDPSDDEVDFDMNDEVGEDFV